jgi:hypothetical protein
VTGDVRVRAPLAYRVLLRLLPAALRREFGDEMQEVMALRLREARTARDRSVASSGYALCSVHAAHRSDAVAA